MNSSIMSRATSVFHCSCVRLGSNSNNSNNTESNSVTTNNNTNSNSGAFGGRVDRVLVHVHRLRKRVRTVLESTDTVYGKIVAAFSTIAILISVTSSCLESLPHEFSRTRSDTNENLGDPFVLVESVTSWIFTLEILVRLGVTPALKKFVRDPYNVLDIIAILPYWLDWVFELVTRALKRSSHGLYLLLFFLSLGVVLFGSVVFYCEVSVQVFDKHDKVWRYEDGTISPFQHIPAAMWWALVTMVTIGYGEIMPITPLGKAFAGLAIVSGPMIIAYPVAMLSSTFLQVYKENSAGNKKTRTAKTKQKKTEQQQPQKQKQPQQQEKQQHSHPHQQQPDTWRDITSRCNELHTLLPDLATDLAKLQGDFRQLERSVEMLLRTTTDVSKQQQNSSYS